MGLGGTQSDSLPNESMQAVKHAQLLQSEAQVHLCHVPTLWGRVTCEPYHGGDLLVGAHAYMQDDR